MKKLLLVAESVKGKDTGINPAIGFLILFISNVYIFETDFANDVPNNLL